MNIQNDKPDEVVEVIKAASYKRKSRKKDIENKSSKKVCLKTVNSSKPAYFPNVRSMQSEDSQKRRKSERVISKTKCKKRSLVEDLDQIQGSEKKLKGKMKSDKGATNSKIMENAQPNAGESDILNNPLIPIFKIKKEPEDFIESNEDPTKNSTIVKNAEANALKLGETDGPQLLILVKQWNAALKEEVVMLRRKETARKLKNEILLDETLKLNQKLNILKHKMVAMNSGKKVLEKQNRMLEHDIDESQHSIKQFELQKQAVKHAVMELHAANKVVMSENKNLKLHKKEFNKEFRKSRDMRKENKNLKCENNILEHSIGSFKKNNQDMCNLKSELEKHNEALNEKLMEYEGSKMEEAITLQHEKELLQTQVKELKSQNQTMFIENECMLMEIKEFVTCNKDMQKTLTELEKHNSAISCKLKDLEDKNQSMSKKILDLQSEISDLTKVRSSKVHSPMSKLNHLGNVKSFEPNAI